MKLKNKFKISKKVVITSICLGAAIGVLATGSKFAVRAMAENKAIGEQAAEKVALVDAKADLNTTRIERTEFEYENGQYIYDVEFTANGKEYDYWIEAYEGRIIYKEVDSTDSVPTVVETTSEATVAPTTQPTSKPSTKTTTKSETKATTKSETKATTKPATTSAPKVESTPAPTTKPTTEKNEKISVSKAKANALADAGLKSSEVTFTKAQLDREDRTYVYDIEFYTADKEYEYEINAYTGKVHSKSSESQPTKNQSASTYIGVDKAKAIAVKHAGLKLSDVTFMKAKLEKDEDGAEYEIEFFHDKVEYEYSISATSGKILDFDSEIDD